MSSLWTLGVSILARPFERALLGDPDKPDRIVVFQSSPALSSGRYRQAARIHDLDIRVSILARPFERALPATRPTPSCRAIVSILARPFERALPSHSVSRMWAFRFQSLVGKWGQTLLIGRLRYWLEGCWVLIESDPIFRPPYRAAGLCGFNGATAFLPWNSCRRERPEPPPCCFNGATAFLPWNSSRISGGVWTWHCFNGATAFLPWNCGPLAILGGWFVALQWGHGISAVEFSPGSRIVPCHTLLQWGHGISAVEF